LEDYGSKLDAEGLAALDRIQRACSRLDVQIRDLLLYTRIAKSQIQLKAIALRPLIEELLDHHPEFGAMRHCFKVEYPLHTVRGNEAYLVQCLTNLLGNALKFVGAGTLPEIRIRSEPSGGKVRVS